MAPRAAPRIGRRPPSDDFSIRRVATLARERDRVIAGIAGRQMPEGRWLPCGVNVAVITVPGRDEMRGRLAGRLHTRVANRAGGCSIDVIKSRWLPNRRRVAGTTLAGHRQVRRRLTRRLGPIVAAAADTDHLRMVDACHRLEGRRVVAIDTCGSRGYVRHRLAFRAGAVVTGDTGR